MKCGIPTPICQLLPSGTLDISSTVKLQTGLVCERNFNLYYTRDFRACCKPKNLDIQSDLTTTNAPSPQNIEMSKFAAEIDQDTADLTEMLKRNATHQEFMTKLAEVSAHLAIGATKTGMLRSRP